MWFHSRGEGADDEKGGDSRRTFEILGEILDFRGEVK